MNRYMKLYALLSVVCLLGACHDDFGNEGVKVVPGQEIQFGATAHFEDGNSTTRTIYGDISSDGTKVEVNWVSGQDHIEIASPHTAGVEIAEYVVTGSSHDDDPEFPTYGVGDGYKELSSATTLQRVGEVGLQWTNESEYEFYAIYPSHNQLKEIITEVGNTDEYGLKYSYDAQGNPIGTLTGYLPVTQDPAGLSNIPSPLADDNVCTVIPPDMRYAYMVAKEHYTVPVDGVINEDKEKIQLAFSSLVTALEFDITTSTIGVQQDGTYDIQITMLRLYSNSGQDICGKFEYTFPQGENENVDNGVLKTMNDGTTLHSQITMSFGENGVHVGEGEALDVTFFLLPSAEKYLSGDLKLAIHYTVAGQPQMKIATINKDLEPRKKYYFKDMKMPPIASNIVGSTWFSAIAPATYLNMLSIPAAGNAFSYYTTSTPKQYYREQTLDYLSLWNLGVRGFEFTTSTNGSSESNNLGGEGFVVNGQEITSDGAGGTISFNKAFRDLTKYIAESASYPEYAKEPVFIICKYQTYGGDGGNGIKPQLYVKQLLNYLQSLITEGYLTKGDFAKLEPKSCVGDVQGKIVILVRPGDNNFGDTDNLSITDNAGNDWSDRVSVIGDWGSCIDQWDRRYGPDWNREGIVTGGTKSVEDYLWGVADSEGATGANAQDIPDQSELIPMETFNGWHTVNGVDKAAFVQDWTRVVPPATYKDKTKGISITEPFYSGISDRYIISRRYLWLQWPSSAAERQKAILNTLNASLGSINASSVNNICINSLCGYYATPNHTASITPYNGEYVFDRNYKFTLSDAGAGGDFYGLAADMNLYFYNQVKSLKESETGPFGIVMMNHIGASAGDFGTSDYSGYIKADSASIASSALPNLIMMNNFRFPMKQDPEYGKTVDPATQKLSDTPAKEGEALAISWRR